MLMKAVSKLRLLLSAHLSDRSILTDQIGAATGRMRSGRCRSWSSAVQIEIVSTAHRIASS